MKTKQSKGKPTPIPAFIAKGVSYAPPQDTQEAGWDLEHLAMNIVFQIGDALSEAKADDFVGKRQETNDMCIDFVKSLLRSEQKRWEADLRKRVKKLENYHWHNPTGKKLVFEDEVLALLDAGKGKV